MDREKLKELHSSVPDEAWTKDLGKVLQEHLQPVDAWITEAYTFLDKLLEETKPKSENQL